MSRNPAPRWRAHIVALFLFQSLGVSRAVSADDIWVPPFARPRVVRREDRRTRPLRPSEPLRRRPTWSCAATIPSAGVIRRWEFTATRQCRSTGRFRPCAGGPRRCATMFVAMTAGSTSPKAIRSPTRICPNCRHSSTHPRPTTSSGPGPAGRRRGGRTRLTGSIRIDGGRDLGLPLGPPAYGHWIHPFGL